MKLKVAIKIIEDRNYVLTVGLSNGMVMAQAGHDKDPLYEGTGCSYREAITDLVEFILKEEHRR